ncbi:MAG TPA: macro domain-containing protein [Actinomycetota bacterium]|nr:macro domain-containing protein [Actinomycetota bacterium]
MSTELVVGDRVLALMKGDITQIPADVIVNAANEALIGGGGVDGAIHRAGGPAIMDDLQRRYGKRRQCPTGSAVVSEAGNLPAQWVIHAVGPRWRGGNFLEADLLWSAYRSSFHMADQLGAKTVTFPAISTGIYGYPVEKAAPVILSALKEGLEQAESVERATLVLFTGGPLTIFEAALQEMASLGSIRSYEPDPGRDDNGTGDRV